MGGMGGGFGFGGMDDGFGGGGMPFGMGGMGGMGGGRRQAAPAKKPDTVHNLSLTLEELYHGAQKKLGVSRSVNGEQVKDVHIIDIRPGWKVGTKITYAGKGGDSAPGSPAPDLVCVIQQKPHDTFVRDGNDLVLERTITLVEALAGYTLSFKHLNGQMYSFPIKDVIQPGQVKSVPNLGMPISKTPGAFGILKVKFAVRFPQHLTPDQQETIRQCLAFSM